MDDEGDGAPYPHGVARDDEFRKVAEEIGALARSLGRDFREAVDQAMRGGYPPGRAVRHGLRDVRDEARRGLRHGWSGPHGRRHGRSWSSRAWGPGYGGWGPPPWGPPPDPGAPGGPAAPAGVAGPLGPPGSEFAGPPYGPAGPYGPASPGAPGAAGPGWAPYPTWTGPSPTPAGAPPEAAPWVGPSRRRPPSRRDRLPPVRHRWDATTVAGMLVVLFGVAWLIGATNVLHVSIEGVTAVGLMLLGASLVVTGRTDWSLSRRSWPVWLGVGLIVVLVATSSTFGLGSSLSSVSFGDMSRTIALGQPAPGAIHGGFGDLTVKLNGDLAHNETLKVVSLAGQTTVDVPENPGYNITYDAKVVGGQICADGTPSNGLNAHSRGTIGPIVAGAPTVNLDIRQMFGQVVIGSGGC
jgi:hypothetical protein